MTPAPRHTAGAGAHAVRAHSKFSASGAERWFNCPGSVELSEGRPDKSSPWAIEGTLAHEVLEAILLILLGLASLGQYDALLKSVSPTMVVHAKAAAKFILGLHARTPDSLVQVETRIHLPFIHPAMFGTFDAGVIDYFDTLHVFDYKYGAGVFVSPTENLQMIFYGLGLAFLHQWNFKKIRLWIIQPRVKGYDGPLFWDLAVTEAHRVWVPRFEKAVRRVEREPDTFVEGKWCHWCKAKSVCPLKRAAKLEEAKSVFSIQPYRGRA